MNFDVSPNFDLSFKEAQAHSKRMQALANKQKRVMAKRELLSGEQIAAESERLEREIQAFIEANDLSPRP